jgi:hypothetical protein
MPSVSPNPEVFMPKRLIVIIPIWIAVSFFWSPAGFSQTPHVVSTTPAQNELNVPVSTNISVTFDVDMDQTTINDSTFVVNARSTGLHAGTITYDGPTKTATFDPAGGFAVGELVTVVLTGAIESAGGTPIKDHAWSFTAVSAVAPANFTLDSNYTVGDKPISVFSADLDGDGDLDLAAANFFSHSVSVLLNSDNGSFASPAAYPVGNYPYSIFSADLDGDGDLDLAAADYGSDSVSVLLNDGDGSFTLHANYAAGDHPTLIFSADLDGDGDLDLATANCNSDNVSVLLNDGNGSFAPQATYTVGNFPTSISSADFDGDGDLDLATANTFSDDVSVLLNNGDGSFAPHTAYAAGDSCRSVFAADLDGD